MKILHIVDPFAGGLATFLKLLTEEQDNNYHIIIHGERRELADPNEIKKIFPKKKANLNSSIDWLLKFIFFYVIIPDKFYKKTSYPKPKYLQKAV